MSERILAQMTVQVQCYAGRKADERAVRFQLGTMSMRSSKFRISGTARKRPSSRSARMTAIFIFCDTLAQQTNGR